MWMSFIKFAILSTVGELIGLRISTGNYYKPGFGILPRALVWGIFGMGINFAFIVFSTGVPAFITYLGLHKITDTHILATGGSLKGFFTPIPMGQIMQAMNWNVQWNFVFKKTIPFFWIPAHTVTFLLPAESRILFAALLGVALGIILAVAARKG